MQVTFFGVRGSCPCAGDDYCRVGGNTSCLLVEMSGEQPLILDLGTGARGAGDALRPAIGSSGEPFRGNALLTHLHFDHILGLPFFGPLLETGAVLDIYGPAQDDEPLQEWLANAVQPPFFPVHMTEFPGQVRFHDTGEEDFALGSAKVRARFVPHPGATLGFRVEADGGSLAYIPDHQAPSEGNAVPDAVLELCEGVDLLVHDAQYTDAEFVLRSDWGHSSQSYALAVASAAGVKRLALFHHDPWHGDDQLDRLVAELCQCPRGRGLEEVILAREGLTLELGRPGRD